MTSSAGISSVPKREESMVRVDMLGKGLLEGGENGSEASIGSAEEIHERRLDDVRAGLQRGLVGGALRVELDQGLREVSVLGLRELVGQGARDLVDARLRGVEAVGLRAVAGADLEQRVEAGFLGGPVAAAPRVAARWPLGGGEVAPA